jgi:NAD-dependent dihydropyrimidine dehydrogenase PreA subunit
MRWPVELPVLDPARCAGTGDCVAVCPTRCLEMRGQRPWLARPMDCVSCGLCAAVCPVGAIRLAPPPPA